MLKILDGTVKLTKTQPEFQIVLDAINAGYDADSPDMEVIYNEAAVWARKLTKLANRVLIAGDAMHPHLYKEVEEFVSDLEYDVESKELKRLLKYIRKASWDNNKHRDYLAIWKAIGNEPLDNDTANQYIESLVAKLESTLRAFSVADWRNAEETLRKSSILIYRATFAAKFFRGLAPAFLSLATISKEYSDLVIAISGPLPGLGKGNLASRIRSAIDIGLTGMSSSHIRRMGDSIVSLMFGCIRAISMLSSPYIVLLAQSLFPESWERLEPNMPYCRDENGELMPWYDVETDLMLGGATGRQMEEAQKYESLRISQYNYGRKINPPIGTLPRQLPNFSHDIAVGRALTCEPVTCDQLKPIRSHNLVKIVEEDIKENTKKLKF